MYNEIWLGVLANIVTAVLFMAVFTLTYTIRAWLGMRERRSMVAFFGVKPTQPRVTIYLSRIQSAGEYAPGSRGFFGECFSRAEYEAALIYRERFKSKWFPMIPRDWFGWLLQREFTWVELDPPIKTSPAESLPQEQIAGLLSENVILVGSDVYNVLSSYVFGSMQSNLYFHQDQAGNRVITQRDTKVRYPSRAEGKETALIQRFVKNGRILTQCAGTGAGATAGAMNFLLKNWVEYKDAEELGLVLIWPKLVDADEPPAVAPVVHLVTMVKAAPASKR